MMTGPLAGVKVVEIGALGPSAFATMLMADLGADVVRIDRARPVSGGIEENDPQFDLLNRGKRSIAVDLKSPDGTALVTKLASSADVVTEGFRPGVAERLGLGPDVLLGTNPRLVYARMTGWGQDGPLAAVAGHDINYIALTGALGAVGTATGPPVVPINLIGDFGGGALYMVVGILAALRDVDASGQGQVVDAAIVDGVSHLLASTLGLLAGGLWEDRRGVNVLDGGAPFYSVYDTSDGKHVAVGAGEGKFYAGLLKTLGIDEDPALQHDRSRWPIVRSKLAAVFAGQTRDHWTEEFSTTDWCVTPVLSLTEAAGHPHIADRRSLLEVDGVVQPGTAPRFSRTRPGTPTPPPVIGQHTRELLQELDLEAGDLLSRGVVAQAGEGKGEE
jgi:alpha-methylacyl-CoA racemase